MSRQKFNRKLLKLNAPIISFFIIYLLYILYYILFPKSQASYVLEVTLGMILYVSQRTLLPLQALIWGFCLYKKMRETKR